MEGRCQCGRITFVTPTPRPIRLYLCHCTECRHQSSSAFGITAAFPYFEIRPPSEGALSYYTRPGSDGESTRGVFCTNCGSRLMHVPLSKDGQPAATVAVKAGCLDGLTRDMMRDAFHIFTRSAVVDIPEGAVQYPEDSP